MYRGDPVPSDRFSHPGDSARTGFTSLRLTQGFAYAGCMDNKIYQFDLCSRAERPIRAFVGCESGSFFVRISVSCCQQKYFFYPKCQLTFQPIDGDTITDNE